MGRSCGGLTTKIHLVIDGTGKPVLFQLTRGNTVDYKQAESLLKKQKAQTVLADKGYDSNAIVYFIKNTLKAEPVISPKRNRKIKRLYDHHLYKTRNLIEIAFNKLKHWRRLATRYDRCDSIFLSSIALTSVAIWT